MENTETEIEVIDFRAILDGDDEEFEGALNELTTLSISEGGRTEILVADFGNGPEEITAGCLLTSLVMLMPYRLAKIAPSPDLIIRKQLNSNELEKLGNKIVHDLYGKVDFDELNQSIAESYAILADIACSVNTHIGVSISVSGILEVAKSDPELRKLLLWSAPDGDLGAIERAADEANAELVERFRNSNSELGRLLRSGSAVNKDQMRQALMNIGVKPGLMDGTLHEEPVDTSYLRGLRNIEDYYICAVGARKALITNFRQVKNSGYLSRKLVLLVANEVIDPELEDCGTQHGLFVESLTEAHAKRLYGRMIAHEEHSEWYYPTDEELKALVGKSIVVRSPATCASKHICHSCYGKTAKANSKIHAGIFGVLVIANQIIQRLLSSKHLLKARPTAIEWPADFLKYFSVERASIIAESQVDRIYINKEDIVEDEESGQRTTRRFFFRPVGQNGRFRMEVPAALILDDETWGSAEDDDTELTVRSTTDTSPFIVPLSNSDLSEALQAFFTLIEREEQTDYNDMYQRAIDIMINTNIDTPSIHVEMIMRALIRDYIDTTQRPRFAEAVDSEPGYVILKLSNAILNNPSVSTSLAFERISAQLRSTTIFKKTQSGMFDALMGG